MGVTLYRMETSRSFPSELEDMGHTREHGTAVIVEKDNHQMKGTG